MCFQKKKINIMLIHGTAMTVRPLLGDMCLYAVYYKKT